MARLLLEAAVSIPHESLAHQIADAVVARLDRRQAAGSR
jgi:hypothetical protein